MPVRVRNEYDRQGLVAVGAIVAAVLEEVGAALRPGLTTGDLDNLAARRLQDYGASATPRREYGFPGSLCVSVNDEAVHGVPGGRVLRGGDVVKLDLTADRRGYVADAARTVVLPPASADHLRLAACARRACRRAIAAAGPGVRLQALGGIIQAVADEDGFTVLREVCGHGVGRRTHEEPEVPNFADHANPGVLEEGMVITIEPILSAGGDGLVAAGDGWTLRTRDGAATGHHEETVIIGRAGAEVTTA
ncbi:MAG: type I methionyl aminopeptidase [Planctomycetes bacterium]|nr:type I methionyl aminopeptidase [Planctomycetota bacterium]